MQDLGTLVKQLVRFLGVSCDKAQLEGMVESCNQLIEQCCNSEALSICRGEEGEKMTMKKGAFMVKKCIQWSIYIERKEEDNR